MRNLTDNIRASAFVQFGRGHHFSFWQFSLPAYAHYTGNDSEHAVVSDILQPITTQRTYMSIPPTAVAAKAIITICMYRFVTVANDTQLHGTTEKARTENAAPKCRGGKGEKMYI